jgi:hypothetical protein
VLVGGVVVADHEELADGAGGGDLLDELEELLVPVAAVTGVGGLSGDISGSRRNNG